MPISELPLGIFPSEQQKMETGRSDSVTVLQRTAVMLPAAGSTKSKKKLDSAGLSRKFSGMMMDKWANVQGRQQLALTNKIVN